MAEEVGKLDLSLLDSMNFSSTIPGVDSGVGSAIKTVGSIEEFSKAEDSATQDENVEVEVEDSISTEDNEIIEETEEFQDVSTGDESAIKLWAQFASERGLIDLEDGEEIGDSEEYLIEKFNKKVDHVFQEYKKSLPEPLQELLDAHEKGIPIEDLLDSESRIAEYSSITEDALKENTDLQKNILRQFLRLQDFEDSEIERKLEKYEDNMLLEDEALTAVKKLVKIEEKHKQEMVKQAEVANKKRQEEYQNRVKTYTDAVMAMDEIIPGIPVTKEQKEAIIKMTTKPVKVLENGMPISALKKMEMEDPNFMTKLAYVAGVLNWDLSAVERTATTKATRQVKNKVESYESKNSPLTKLDLAAIRKAVKASNKQLFK